MMQRRAPGRLKHVSTLSPQDRFLLANVAASARLEGQELPEEDLALTTAYLVGEIDTATYEQRLLALVTGRGEPQARTA